MWKIKLLIIILIATLILMTFGFMIYLDTPEIFLYQPQQTGILIRLVIKVIIIGTYLLFGILGIISIIKLKIWGRPQRMIPQTKRFNLFTRGCLVPIGIFALLIFPFIYSYKALVLVQDYNEKPVTTITTSWKKSVTSLRYSPDSRYLIVFDDAKLKNVYFVLSRENYDKISCRGSESTPCRGKIIFQYLPSSKEVISLEVIYEN